MTFQQFSATCLQRMKHYMQPIQM
uniref:Uncharacterized protein n=1 Tax=Anguilla anguilla TaxID=7936 RepID=A0A0E9VVL2_ANGAN